MHESAYNSSMLEIEPFPESLLPKSMRGIYKGELARHIYRYHAVSRGPARIIIHEYDERQAAGRKIAFSHPDIVFYFAKVAGEGIIGNLAFKLIMKIANGVREPLKEIFRPNIEFLSVVPKETYNRLRRQRHPGKRATSKLPESLKSKVEDQYKALVPQEAATKPKKVRKEAVK